METTTFYENNEDDTTVNPNGEYTSFTTTPVEQTNEKTTESPQSLYNKYANTTPPFPLFPNVSPPSFSGLSQSNSCNTAVADYTKQIKEAAAYINQETNSSKPKDNENDPLAKAGSVIQKALNVSNSSSVNCVCSNVAANTSNVQDSSEYIQFSMKNVQATNFNLDLSQTSTSKTYVINVLSANFTNTVNNTIKNNLNIFASQVNKVKNASPTGLGNSQKFFNAIQNSLMNVVNNNTVSNTANSQFTEASNTISLSNIDAKNININDAQSEVQNTYVKSVTDAVTNNALKNIGINTEGITAAMDNTDEDDPPKEPKPLSDFNPTNFGEYLNPDNIPEDSPGNYVEKENTGLYYLFLVPFLVSYILLLLLVFVMTYKNKFAKVDKIFDTIYENTTVMKCWVGFTMIYGFFTFLLMIANISLYPIFLVCLILIIVFLILSAKCKQFKVINERDGFNQTTKFIEKSFQYMKRKFIKAQQEIKTDIERL